MERKMIDADTLDQKRIDELKAIASKNVAPSSLPYSTELEKLCAFANAFLGYMLEDLDKSMKDKVAAKLRRDQVDDVVSGRPPRKGPY